MRCNEQVFRQLECVLVASQSRKGNECTVIGFDGEQGCRKLYQDHAGSLTTVALEYTESTRTCVAKAGT